METQLFTWKNFDICDTMCFVFYDCTLKVEIGRFAAGDHVQFITVDYENGTIHLDNTEDGAGPGVEHKLKLSVV